MRQWPSEQQSPNHCSRSPMGHKPTSPLKLKIRLPHQPLALLCYGTRRWFWKKVLRRERSQQISLHPSHRNRQIMWRLERPLQPWKGLMRSRQVTRIQAWKKTGESRRPRQVRRHKQRSWRGMPIMARKDLLNRWRRKKGIKDKESMIKWVPSSDKSFKPKLNQNPPKPLKKRKLLINPSGYWCPSRRRPRSTPPNDSLKIQWSGTSPVSIVVQAVAQAWVAVHPLLPLLAHKDCPHHFLLHLSTYARQHWASPGSSLITIRICTLWWDSTTEIWLEIHRINPAPRPNSAYPTSHLAPGGMAVNCGNLCNVPGESTSLNKSTPGHCCKLEKLKLKDQTPALNKFHM